MRSPNQNIPPIKGVTTILLNLSNAPNERDRKFMTDVLFALMLLKSCENAKLFVAPPNVCWTVYKEIRPKIEENSLLTLANEIQNLKDTNPLFSTTKTNSLENKVIVCEDRFFPADLIR